MQTYVFILQGKQRGQQTNELLLAHVDHLKKLNADGVLVVCGPFADDDGAIQILRAKDKTEAIAIFEKDPFIEKRYYQSYKVHELFEANDANNWLMDSDQTLTNLKK